MLLVVSCFCWRPQVSITTPHDSRVNAVIIVRLQHQLAALIELVATTMVTAIRSGPPLAFVIQDSMEPIVKMVRVRFSVNDHAGKIIFSTTQPVSIEELLSVTLVFLELPAMR